ncbi:MAG: UDP-N-acetylmuramoyl-L-alanyl-D-glutamate--2,6-diaminopimelate ligase [Patescibacteria group bacterium]
MIKNLIKKFLPSFVLDWYHFKLAFLGALIYRFPSRNLKVIGVTGTNGKSTVVEMITKIFETAGIPVASQSTIRFKIKDKEWPNTYKMTMPGRFFIQKFLRQSTDAGCQYAIIEVTSEGIKQFRHKFINFDAAVFTNLAPEHIEAHGNFENYKKAKGKLFQITKNIHIINADDKSADYFLQFAAKKTYTFGLSKGDINYQNTNFKLQLLGDFNISNALAAIGAGISQGISTDICKRAVEKITGIPGRMEMVVSEPFLVFVDYAFTPNALEKVYQTLTANYKLPSTKLVCLLGACGGGRDKWKRKVLGQIAAKYCDEIIVTNEDPYEENPEKIIREVASGAGRKAKTISDRREAIKEALKIARPNDAVVLTGKGSEPWICQAGGKKIPWDEKKAVLEEMAELKNH